MEPDVVNPLILKDKEGDVEAQPGSLGLGGSAASQHFDWLGLQLGVSSPRELNVTLALKNAADPSWGSAHGRQLQIFFRSGQYRYSLSSTTQSTCRFYLFGSGQDLPSFGRCVETVTDLSNHLIRLPVPMHLVRNESGVSFQPGMVLEDVYATSHLMNASGARIADRVPDVDAARFRYPSGGAMVSLTAARAMEPSNGDTATFAYRVYAINHDSKVQDLLLFSGDMPADWIANFPPRLSVASNSSKDFPVILTVPFSHNHSQTVSFPLHAVSSDGEVNATMDLGVHFLEIPQPAGHHNKVWLHTDYPEPAAVSPESPAVAGWFNTLRTDPDPSTTDSSAVHGQTLSPTTFRWVFPMRPALQVGLTFDKSGQGELNTMVRSDFAVQSAALSAVLEITGRRTQKILEGVSQAFALQAGQGTPVQVKMNVAEAVGTIHFTPGANLRLSVQLQTTTPASSPFSRPGPVLDTKASSLSLPLADYRVPAQLSFGNSLMVRAQGPAERDLNPGRQLIFPILVNNTSPNVFPAQLEVLGLNADWALASPARFSIPANGSKAIEVSVAAPVDAVSGERAELFVMAKSRKDPSEVAFTLIRANVIDPSVREIPDERRGSQQSTPHLSIIMALLTILGAMRAARCGKS